MMRTKVLILTSLMCSLAWAGALEVIAPESVGLSSERLARIDRTFQELVDQGEIAGVSLLISRRGQVAYRHDLGFMDMEAKRAMAPNAIFRIASMTKALTSVAVLQLFEQGRFLLDDPAACFIPVLKTMRVMDPNQDGADPNHPRTVPLTRDITIRDLLRHTSGIYGGDRYTRAGLRDWTGSLQGFVERLASVPLACQPGTRFYYSYSTDVLGYLVELVSGQPLDEYIDEHITTPLDMIDTGFVVPSDKVLRLTNHYRFADGHLVCKEQASSSPFLKRAKALSGGGGWSYSYPGAVTTVRDWWRFMEMLRNYGQLDGVCILSPNTVKLMCSDHLDDIPGAFEPGVGFGLGVGVVTDTVKHGQLTGNGMIFWAGAPHNTYYFVDFNAQMCGLMFMQNGPWNHLDLMRRFLVLSHQAIIEPPKSKERVDQDAIEKAVLKVNAEIVQAGNALDVDQFFAHIVGSGKGLLIQDGVLFKTRQEAYDAIKRGFQGIAKLERAFDQTYVAVVSPQCAVLTGTGHSTATLNDGRTLSRPFAASMIYILQDGQWKLLQGHYSMPSRP